MHVYHPLTQNYLLSQIFSFIEKQKDLYNFTLVNSSWNYSASTYLYRSPKLKEYEYVKKFIETLLLSKQKKTLLPYNEMVREWNIFYMEFADIIAECCPFIEKITCVAIVKDNLEKKPMIFNNLIKHWNNLRTISLYNYSGTDETLKSIKDYCLRLEEINLDSKFITDIGLVELIKSCRLIKRLKLKCDNITDESMKVISIHCKYLIELHICDCNLITDIGILSLSEISFAKNLNRLTLEKLNIRESSLIVLAKNTINIQELYFKRINELTDEVISLFGDIRIKREKSINKLNLNICSNILGSGLKEFLELKELSLFMQSIKLNYLQEICNNCQKIEKLTLDVKFITDDIINAISKLKNLKSLAMFCGRGFEDSDIFGLRRDCPKLNQINC
ncbi:17755_t:CDS:2 [Entrophospora sp. SA101]|nr:17755_t:CDS:2 [Entrophospora sp. SA101]